METDIEFLQKKATEYFNRGIFVHIKTKKDSWYNGTILEVSADFILFLDRFDGQLPIFFLEIETLEPYNLKHGEWKT